MSFGDNFLIHLALINGEQRVPYTLVFSVYFSKIKGKAARTPLFSTLFCTAQPKWVCTALALLRFLGTQKSLSFRGTILLLLKNEFRLGG